MEMTKMPFKLFIFDNNSPQDVKDYLENFSCWINHDDSIKNIKYQCKRISLILSEDNIGKASGMNCLHSFFSKRNECDYIVNIDSDIVINTDGWESIFINFLESNSNYGIIAPNYVDNGKDPFMMAIVAPTNNMLSTLIWPKFRSFAAPFEGNFLSSKNIFEWNSNRKFSSNP